MPTPSPSDTSRAPQSAPATATSSADTPQQPDTSPSKKESLMQYIKGFFSIKGYIERQADVESEIRQGVSFKGSNSYILILAMLVASLGLTTNSTAVIIGAMLISPLMGPIIGIGLAIGIQDFHLLRQSLRSLGSATIISVLASACFFLIAPVSEGHSELLARTSPTIYDVLIAFFGGGAGIVGMSARSKGNVIPGVAIATALMPPLCTVGYGLATLQLHYFLGALYLFIINCIFIALATFVGVKLMKFNQYPAADVQRSNRIRKWVYAIAILTLLPSIYLTWRMFQQSTANIAAEKFVETNFDFPDTQVLGQKLYQGKKGRQLDVTLIGRPINTDSMVLVLQPLLAQYGLKGTTLNIVQGGTIATPAHQNASISEIYNAAQAAIVGKQATIDSLRTELAGVARRDTIGAAMAPELKVVFPQVSDIAISRNVFCDVNTGRLDTAEVALVSYRHPISAAEKAKLQKYIEARIGAKRVQVVHFE
ncbi:MAG: DUF389 domain-containing protein [Muribaculaceae bacterium]|nr:DUF389 domain-containing protein [Muribaculaceae bacterium]